MSAPAASRGTSPLVVQCLVFLCFAMPLGVFPSAWPEARSMFDQSAAALGTLATAYGIGRLSTSASASLLLARVSVRSVTVALCLALALVDVGLAVSRSFALALVGIALIGLASGGLDSLGSRYQAVIRDVRRSGLMFGSYGVGATLGPLVVAVSSWTVGFAAAAGVATVAALAAARPGVEWPEGMADPPRRQRVGVAPVSFDRRGVALSLALAGTVVALEANTGNWMATYFEDFRGSSGQAAALAVSGFWAGVTLGRLLLGSVRVSAAWILTRAPVAVVVGYAVVALVPRTVAMVGLVGVGALLGVLFPTVTATTVDRAGAAAAGRVSGWQLFAANLTATTVIAGVGIGVSHWGEGVPMVALVGLAVVAVPLCWRGAVRVPPDEPALGPVPPPA
ncbi:MAG: MFS transporter [Iamia sp.]